MSKAQILLEMLKTGDVLKTDADKIGGSRNRTYQFMHELRKKGYIIEFLKDIIHLKGMKEVKNLPSTIVKPATSVIDTLNIAGIHKSILRKIASLPTQDKKDALDMLKKSIFYGMSATALIKANDVIHSIEENS